MFLNIDKQKKNKVAVRDSDGHVLTYGQLKETAFEPESYMEAGATLGYVREPTKYYSKEGSNLYFAMTKDGVSVDPLEYLP